MDASAQNDRGKHTGGGLPVRTLILAGWAILVLLVCGLYTSYLNPEIQFLKRAWELKTESLVESESAKGRILICGGSSVLVGVAPDIVASTSGRPVINLGLAAGMGADVLASLAVDQLREGDLLVVSIEPDLLTLPSKTSMLGSQVSWTTGNPHWLSPRTPDQWMVSLSHLRPGAYHAVTLAGKLLLGKPLYRYHSDELKQGGWQEIAFREEKLGIPVFGYNLTARGREVLQDATNKAEAAGARILYVPSYHFCHADRLENHLVGMNEFLNQVEQIMPVIRAEDMHATWDAKQFADTPWHPHPAVAKSYSVRLGNYLKNYLASGDAGTPTGR